MAEYHVLIPGSIVLSMAFLLILGQGLGDIYHDAVGALLNAFGFEGPQITELLDAPDNICVEVGDIFQQQGGYYCDQSGNCSLLEAGYDQEYNIGTHTADGPIDMVIIKTGRVYHILNPSFTDDGCLTAVFNGNSVSWEKADIEDPLCKDVSHVQAWESPICE
jgi:hypothetical protein